MSESTLHANQKSPDTFGQSTRPSKRLRELSQIIYVGEIADLLSASADDFGMKRMLLYGKAAILAQGLLSEESEKTPKEAWDEAVKKVTQSRSSQRKLCPKFIFLGLCEEGIVKQIVSGNYVGHEKNKKSYHQNKQYAIKVVGELRKDPSLAGDPTSLWAKITSEQHNNQMDVVIALWNHGLIAPGA
jgi:hypothetical protein